MSRNPRGGPRLRSKFLTALHTQTGTTHFFRNAGGPKTDGAPSLAITVQGHPIMVGRISSPGILGDGEAQQTTILLEGLFVMQVR